MKSRRAAAGFRICFVQWRTVSLWHGNVIQPHNASEVIDAGAFLIETPKATTLT